MMRSMRAGSSIAAARGVGEFEDVLYPRALGAYGTRSIETPWSERAALKAKRKKGVSSDSTRMRASRGLALEPRLRPDRAGSVPGGPMVSRAEAASSATARLVLARKSPAPPRG